METRANANFHIQSYLIIVNSPLQPFEFENYGRPSGPLQRLIVIDCEKPNEFYRTYIKASIFEII